MDRAVLLKIITDAQAGQANFIRTSWTALFQPFVRCLSDAILQATLNGVLPSFSESQKRCFTNIIIRDAIERIQ